MGNRAVVVFKYEAETHGVYLHWNGGPESILAFLRAMEERKWTRMDYASARFVGIVSEFFDSTGDGDGLSLAILDDPDAWKGGCDNGLYEVMRSADGFEVLQRGKPVSYEKLNEEERKQHDDIVDLLAELRQARKARTVAEVQS